MAVDWGSVYDTAWGIFGVIAGFGAIIVMLWVSHRSRPERDAEVEAREFYEAHGHWPDQEPGAPPDPLPPVG
jgi:hypothetical protein